MNILAILNDPKDFKTVEPVLAANEIKITYATDLTEAISHIQSGSFQVVLISWNLHMIDVVKTYEFLDDKLVSMVVVFSESDKPSILKQLLASRIQKTIFPPLSGPGMLKRLQQLMRARGGIPEEAPKSLGLVAVTGAEVPSDVTWEVSPTSAPAPNGDKLWQGVSVKDDTQTFVYQGQEAPKWNASSNGWDAPGNAFLKISNEARSSLGTVFGQPIQRKPKVTVLGVDSEPLKKYSMPSTNETDGSALFFASLSAALEIVNSVFCDPNEVQGEGNKVAVSWVQAGKVTGMVLVGDPSETAESMELLKTLQGEVYADANRKKEKYEVLIDKAVVAIAPTNLTRWSSRQTKYDYGVKGPSTKVVMAYLPVDKKMDMAMDETGQYYTISVSEALRPGVKAPCDFFVFMKKNQRFVRYLTKDSPITDGTIAKLLESQISQVMFHKDDLDAFLGYKAKYYLGLTK